MKIGILGATGAVGRQMLECIKGRNISTEEIRLFASEKSKGTVIDGLTVQVANEDTIQGLDVMLGAITPVHSDPIKIFHLSFLKSMEKML